MMTFAIESEVRSRGYDRIAGVDEAGRGPLAGPLVAAAVVLPEEGDLSGLDDSKRLSPKAREAMFVRILDIATGVGVGVASAEEIDEINVLQATFLAMRRALQSLSCGHDFALVDGNLRINGEHAPQETIVGGDGRCASIAAASIVAKVTRDRLMVELHSVYPEYAFDVHKGYHTPLHIQRLAAHGVSNVHRRSFAPVAALLGEGQCRLPTL